MRFRHAPLSWYLAILVVVGPSAASGGESRTSTENDSPVLWDWAHQDHVRLSDDRPADDDRAESVVTAIRRVLDASGSDAKRLRAEFSRLRRDNVAAGDRRWLDLYVKACERRRATRLQPLIETCTQIVFTKHYNLGGSHYAYTEGQSDAQRERHFKPGSALCVLELDGIYGKVRTLIDDPNGVIRDPAISYDGKRILFAWKKSDRRDDYHLYEMAVASGEVRQLTFGLGFADYEGTYLPNGDILFSSTRCVQTVDCWWTEVSNLYTCEPDGRHLRRLGFDQVHTNYPTVMDDGRVIYTRWEYSDRGQIYVQSLFQMNPDGTGQTEFYGNNSWFPTAILHARGIPGSEKVMAVASGHHCIQTGKLIVIDPARGRQEAAGVQLIAPVRKTQPVRVDAYGQHGDVFQYPYPLTETSFLVAYDPIGWARTDKRPGLRSGEVLRFKIYYMTADGRRELLVADPRISCSQPVLLVPRARPQARPNRVDYRNKTGTYFVQDVYAGRGLAGVVRGTVKRLRVVGLEYRAAGIGSNRNRGPAGAALISTPVAIDNGSWDVKVVLGDAEVYEDGSACFTVPAQTPVYFQALDANGHAVQTMRSWSTLQPGETFSCVGCHETRNDAPRANRGIPLAMRAGPQRLESFYGPPRGFSFNSQIQPILDRHCIRCHNRRDAHVAANIRASASHCNPSDSCGALNDRLEPKHSDDHSIPRFTWYSRKGTREWVQYDFEKPATVAAVDVYWFDDRVRSGGCGVPKSWRVLYRHDGRWREVSEASGHGVERDKYNKTRFKPVTTSALRLEVKLRPNLSGGILEWRVVAAGQTTSKTTAFSLLGTPSVDTKSLRKWSDAYLALTQHGRPNRIVNWISAQSAPPVLPPYHAGAARSALVSMLENGHEGVKLSREALDKIACWIDLLVPYCGDYTEANAWSPDQVTTYDHFLRKRRRMARIERKNIEALIVNGSGHQVLK